MMMRPTYLSMTLMHLKAVIDAYEREPISERIAIDLKVTATKSNDMVVNNE